MSALRRTAIVVLLATLVASCSSTPDNVLSKSDMADLLVDINIGESITEMNFREYDNDSVKKVLRQSILSAHGVTSEEYDRSIEWYGHNIEKYQEVYEEVIHRLEKRIAEEKVNGSRDDGQQAAVPVVAEQSSFEGDSIDVWTQPRSYVFAQNISSEYVTFNLARDANSKAGDVYTLRFKALNSNRPIKCAIVATYDNATTDIATNDGLSFGDESAPADYQSVKLRTSPDKTAAKVFGFIYVKTVGPERVRIGDISLVRSRFSAEEYEKLNSQISETQEDDGSVTLHFDDATTSDFSGQGNNDKGTLNDENIDRREMQSRLEDERRALIEQGKQQDNAGNKQRHINESRIPTPRPTTNRLPQSGNETKKFDSNTLRRRE